MFSLRRTLPLLTRPSSSSSSSSSRHRLTLSTPLLTRNFTTTAPRPAKKGAEDRTSISTESTEYSKSGGDGRASSAVDEAAFSPDKTRPEEVYESAKKESGGESENPLNVSPANRDVSRTNDAQKEGVTGSKGETGEGREERARTSGGSQ